jgi:hypothetical protein
MKQTFTLFSVLLLTGSLLVAVEGCKGPEGPAGPPGESTILQLEGFAADINCGDCHNPDTDTVNFVWGRKYEWENSKHAYGGDYERAGASCSECHTTEGFLQWTQGKTVTAALHPTPPGCFACHSPHSRADFSIRTTTPVTMLETVTGQGTGSFDYGKGNLCASCHRPRSISPKPDPTKTAVTDTITISNNRWYAHYGVQAQLLMGTGGFEFTDYTYTGNSAHTNAPLIKSEGCIQCHMADPPITQSYPFGVSGAHTMKIGYDNHGTPASLLEGCKNSACHPSITSVDYHSVQTIVHAYLDTLETMMKDTSIVNKWNKGAKKAWIAGDAVTGFTPNGASGSGALKISPASRAGAMYNFFFVEHDLSHGVHNSVYAIDLLKSSVAELRKP